MSALPVEPHKLVINATSSREFQRKDYSGTITFIKRKFVISWHSAKDTAIQKEFELLSDILLVKARQIVGYFQGKELYFWDAKVVNSKVEIKIEGLAIDAAKIPLDMKIETDQSVNVSRQIAKLYLRQSPS
jgi:hypothetical protein